MKEFVKESCSKRIKLMVNGVEPINPDLHAQWTNITGHTIKLYWSFELAQNSHLTTSSNDNLCAQLLGKRRLPRVFFLYHMYISLTTKPTAHRWTISFCLLHYGCDNLLKKNPTTTTNVIRYYFRNAKFQISVQVSALNKEILEKMIGCFDYLSFRIEVEKNSWNFVYIFRH